MWSQTLDLDYTDKSGDALLHLAAEAGQRELCGMILITEGFQELSAKNAEGKTAADLSKGELKKTLLSVEAGSAPTWGFAMVHHFERFVSSAARD